MCVCVGGGGGGGGRGRGGGDEREGRSLILRGCMDFRQITHKVQIFFFDGLLGERSEPHTGVFNRDFA